MQNTQTTSTRKPCGIHADGHLYGCPVTTWAPPAPATCPDGTSRVHVAALREADEAGDLATFETLAQYASCAEMAEFYGEAETVELVTFPDVASALRALREAAG